LRCRLRDTRRILGLLSGRLVQDSGLGALVRLEREKRRVRMLDFCSDNLYPCVEMECSGDSASCAQLLSREPDAHDAWDGWYSSRTGVWWPPARRLRANLWTLLRPLLSYPRRALPHRGQHG
jgi:hypothetical protein